MFSLLNSKPKELLTQYFDKIKLNPLSFDEKEFKEVILPQFKTITQAKTFLGNSSDTFVKRAFEYINANSSDLFIAFVHFNDNCKYDKKRTKLDDVYQTMLSIVKKDTVHNNGEITFNFKNIKEKVSKNFPLFIYDLEMYCLKNKQKNQKDLISQPELMVLLELEFKHNFKYFLEDMSVTTHDLNQVIDAYNEKNQDSSILDRYLHYKSQNMSYIKLDNYYQSLSDEKFKNQITQMNSYKVLRYLFNSDKKTSTMVRKYPQLSQKILQHIAPNKIIQHFNKKNVVVELMDLANSNNENLILQQIKQVDIELIVKLEDILPYFDKLRQKETYQIMTYVLEQINKQNNREKLFQEICKYKRFLKNEKFKIALEKLMLDNKLLDSKEIKEVSLSKKFKI